MNLYVRFFDYEALVPDEDGVLDFLSTIPQIRMDSISEKKLHKFLEGDSRYPFKGKIDDRNYYLVIKTEEETLEAFQKAQEEKELENADHVIPFSKVEEEKKVS